jgi:hypothetical protein
MILLVMFAALVVDVMKHFVFVVVVGNKVDLDG